MATTATFNNVVGINPQRVTTTAEYALGTTVNMANNVLIYVKAGATHTAAERCDLTANVTSDNASGTHETIAAMVANDYGWVKKYTSPFA